jgi:NADPH:quinone reductase-like Zn-dependent oxidoreductase
VGVEPVYVVVSHFQAMNEVIARAALRPVIDRVFPFEEAPRGYEYLRSGAHFGKIVIAF